MVYSLSEVVLKQMVSILMNKLGRQGSTDLKEQLALAVTHQVRREDSLSEKSGGKTDGTLPRMERVGRMCLVEKVEYVSWV